MQRRALEVVATGKSALLVAPTASGKTEAGIMPLVVETLDHGGRILYIAPTKALINDLRDRLRPGFGALGLNVESRHGDSRATQAVYARAACVITTPESLEVALEFGDEWLADVRRIFLDELHAYEGTPRGTQARVLLTRLRQRVGIDLRIVAVSATVPDFDSVAREWGRPGPPLHVLRQGGQRSGRIVVSLGGGNEIRTWMSSPTAPDKVLLFANSRRRCDELFLGLLGASDHVVMLHYSNLEAGQRADTEALLRRSQRAVCVATSTLELGIDIGDIDAVVLADAPWSSLNLIQRVGRAARRKGEVSATAFVDSDRTLLRILAAWLTDPNIAIGDGLRPRFTSVGVQQLIELALASRHHRVRASKLDEAFSDTDTLDAKDGQALVEHLRQQGVLAYHVLSDAFELPPNSDLANGHERWGNFPKDRASWVLASKGRPMTAVEFDEAPARGAVVLFGGRMWRVLSIARRTINLVPTAPVENPVRVHYSDAPPLVPASLAERMAAILAGELVPATVQMDEGVSRRLSDLQGELASAMTAGGAPIVRNERGLKLLTFAGTRANILLKQALSGATRVDEIGIELDREMPLVSLNKLLPPYDELIDLAGRAWRRLVGSVTITRWHEYLPPRLQRAEVMSQLDGTHVRSAIEAVRSRSAVLADRLKTSL